MKHWPILVILLMSLAACGNQEVRGPETSVPTPTTTTTTPPEASERARLRDARAQWDANRPDSYRFTFTLICECDQGPWTVLVDGARVVEAHRQDTGGPAESLPYQSIDAIFDEIAATLDTGEVPVEVDYDTELGYPRSYTWNGPELPVDGGFILTITSFEPEPTTGDTPLRQDLLTAIERWEAAGLTDYDYSFTRGCFCPPEFVGPFRVEVRGGEVTRATFEGTDLFSIGMLELGRYDEIIKTVPAVFAEIDRALREADRIDAAYHPTLGYPTEVFIDWELNAADEEVSYTIAGLRAPLPELASCSTTGVDIALVPQPDLPDVVADTRTAIFDAAMACDIAALAGISEGDDGVPVETSFGGSGPEYFLDQEMTGIPALRTLVDHLNLPYAPGHAGDSYVWPSAFENLTSPYGDGLAADDYGALLELYTVDGLEEMFEFFGGYVGYRVVIAADGEWLFAIAGD